MMILNNRRSFLKKIGFLSSFSFIATQAHSSWERKLNKVLEAENIKNTSPQELAGDEVFWSYVQQSYTVSSSLINLNNAGVSPSPKVVQEAMKRYHDYSNEAPSYYMWRILDQGRELLRRKLAMMGGCDMEEIALQRNATEALETIIFGLPLKPGDEVVLSKQDYPSMINAWKQREQRDKIKLIWVNLELPSEDNEYLTNCYTKAFTSKTKVVHITHLINWNGQILPVRKIADIAHRKGIEVVVDGAQTFAHFTFTIPELGADYYGASLHKWLSATIGTGLLYVKKEKIGSLYPLFSAIESEVNNIRKFEHLGTRPFFIEQAVVKAIEFHEMIGEKRKEERLFYLKNYWMSKVQDFPNVKLHTSMKKGFGCAIGLVSIEGKKSSDLANFLFDKYKIHAIPIDYENINGLRVSPNVYTSTKDLDILVEGIQQFLK